MLSARLDYATVVTWDLKDSISTRLCERNESSMVTVVAWELKDLKSTRLCERNESCMATIVT